MAAPETWSVPSSGATIAGVTPAYNNLYHAGNYWFNVVRDNSVGTALYLRYASDPTGAWSTATLPAWPTGTTFVTPNPASGVYFDGTHYAITLRVAGTAGSRIYYATDPSGTWSEHDTGNELTYRTNVLIHDGSRWIIGGSYFGGTPSGGFIGYTGAGSAVTSTYTLGTVTGYNPADVSASARWVINAIEFDGTHYVTEAIKSAGGTGLPSHLRYTSDITSTTWGTPTTSQVESVNMLRYVAEVDYWITMGPNPIPYYSQDPTGTWTALGTATTQNKLELLGIDYGNGYWAAGGAREESLQSRPSIIYVQGASPAAATYTSVGSAGMGFAYTSSNQVWDVVHHGGYFVAASKTDCELRYVYVGLPGPTVLRQRQSPVRTPSRVRGVNLRARQTPYIT